MAMSGFERLRESELAVTHPMMMVRYLLLALYGLNLAIQYKAGDKFLFSISKSSPNRKYT